MTPEQKSTIDLRKAEGFQVIGADRDGVVRITKGGDQRVVFTDGREKRGQHDFSRRQRA